MPSTDRKQKVGTGSWPLHCEHAPTFWFLMQPSAVTSQKKGPLQPNSHISLSELSLYRVTALLSGALSEPLCLLVFALFILAIISDSLHIIERGSGSHIARLEAESNIKATSTSL